MMADLVTVRPPEVWRGMMINLILVLSKECGENLTKYLSGAHCTPGTELSSGRQRNKRINVIW